ncbi:MAG: TetR/AcrR family transcriptional regulator [Gemmatimonadetes bacterium]|nr:TetR/AcrR family transcriptional regulator [Gemmatimonadota bacterium]
MKAEALRTRQAAVAREAILQAFVSHLEAGGADELTMDQLAREAGVSRRTLYRYFPGRPALLAAAGEWISAEVLELPTEIGPEGIAASFRAAAARLERRPALARALLRTETGRAVRSGHRAAQVRAMREAVRAAAPTAPAGEVERAAAVLACLCGSNAWATIQDEAGLDAASAQAAVEWAIDALLARLRQDAGSPRDAGGS